MVAEIKGSRDARQSIPDSKGLELKTKSIIQQRQGEGKGNHKIERMKREAEFVLTNFPIKPGTSAMSQRALEFQILQLWNEGIIPNAIASKLQCALWEVENTIECQRNYEAVRA